MKGWKLEWLGYVMKVNEINREIVQVSEINPSSLLQVPPSYSREGQVGCPYRV